MKYLIMAHPGSTPIPPEMGAQLYQAATEWMNVRLADGRLECHYVFMDMGGFAIANLGSHEEVFQAITSYPLFAFFEWEAKALCDWKSIYATLIQNFQSLGG